MRALSIRPLLGIAALSAAIIGPVFAEPSAGHGPAIVLFGARWCAPCMIEYQHLAELAEAAAPYRIMLAWVDRPIAVPAALAGRIDTIETAKARDLAQATMGVGYGLPFAIMLDSMGHTCAIRRGPLTKEHLTALRRACEQG